MTILVVSLIRKLHDESFLRTNKERDPHSSGVFVCSWHRKSIRANAAEKITSPSISESVEANDVQTSYNGTSAPRNSSCSPSAPSLRIGSPSEEDLRQCNFTRTPSVPHLLWRVAK